MNFVLNGKIEFHADNPFFGSFRLDAYSGQVAVFVRLNPYICPTELSDAF